MFSNARSFNQDIGDWNVSNVEEIHSVFSNAHSFNQDIGDWNVSNMSNMFFNASEICRICFLMLLPLTKT